MLVLKVDFAVIIPNVPGFAITGLVLDWNRLVRFFCLCRGWFAV